MPHLLLFGVYKGESITLSRQIKKETLDIVHKVMPFTLYLLDMLLIPVGHLEMIWGMLEAFLYQMLLRFSKSVRN